MSLNFAHVTLLFNFSFVIALFAIIRSICHISSFSEGSPFPLNTFYSQLIHSMLNSYHECAQVLVII